MKKEKNTGTLLVLAMIIVGCVIGIGEIFISDMYFIFKFPVIVLLVMLTLSCAIKFDQVKNIEK